MTDAPRKPPTLPPSRYYLSPVDYEAWAKGYVPPSEHVLIDELSYRGARVAASVQGGGRDGPAWWLVIKGKTTPKMVLQIARLLDEWECEEEAAQKAPAPSSGEQSLSPSEASAATAGLDDPLNPLQPETPGGAR